VFAEELPDRGGVDPAAPLSPCAPHRQRRFELSSTQDVVLVLDSDVGTPPGPVSVSDKGVVVEPGYQETQRRLGAAERALALDVLGRHRLRRSEDLNKQRRCFGDAKKRIRHCVAAPSADVVRVNADCELAAKKDESIAERTMRVRLLLSLRLVDGAAVPATHVAAEHQPEVSWREFRKYVIPRQDHRVESFDRRGHIAVSLSSTTSSSALHSRDRLTGVTICITVDLCRIGNLMLTAYQCAPRLDM